MSNFDADLAIVRAAASGDGQQVSDEDLRAALRSLRNGCAASPELRSAVVELLTTAQSTPRGDAAEDGSLEDPSADALLHVLVRSHGLHVPLLLQAVSNALVDDAAGERAARVVPLLSPRLLGEESVEKDEAAAVALAAVAYHAALAGGGPGGARGADVWTWPIWLWLLARVDDDDDGRGVGGFLLPAVRLAIRTNGLGHLLLVPETYYVDGNCNHNKHETRVAPIDEATAARGRRHLLHFLEHEAKLVADEGGVEASRHVFFALLEEYRKSLRMREKDEQGRPAETTAGGERKIVQVTALLYPLLDLTGDVLAAAPIAPHGSNEASVRRFFYDSGCLSRVIEVLVWLARDDVEKARRGPTGRRKATEEEEALRGFRSLHVRVIANALEEGGPGQDQVRRMGGLVAVLNSTRIDDLNPLQREWAILALRNLTRGNEDNQQFLLSLRAEEVVQDDYLDAMGLEAVLGDDGKVTIRKKEPQ